MCIGSNNKTPASFETIVFGHVDKAGSTGPGRLVVDRYFRTSSNAVLPIDFVGVHTEFFSKFVDTVRVVARIAVYTSYRTMFGHACGLLFSGCFVALPLPTLPLLPIPTHKYFPCSRHFRTCPLGSDMAQRCFVDQKGEHGVGDNTDQCNGETGVKGE